MFKFRSRFGCLILAMVSGLATAGARDVYVPPELRPWTDWALEGKAFLDCPFLFNETPKDEQFICAWPGRLRLSIDDGGGRFEQAWTVYAGDNWLALPGDGRQWPQQVLVDGKPALVVDRDAAPSLRLGPGTYQVTGRFEWAERPRTLRVPSATGLVDLSVAGRPIEQPERDGPRLWLGERQREQQAQDALSLQVFRLVEDGIPVRLTTRLQLDVSGSVREELLGPTLPEGFARLALDSQLPARLEPDGRLRLQLRPGRWSLNLVGRATDAGDVIALSQAQTNWPAEEIWSYRSNDQLRITAVEGLEPVDPGQAQVPNEWQLLPAYRIRPGQALRIEERSRGMVAADNQLDLVRQLWLDFGAAGFTFIDTVTGTMRSEWRLDMDMPFVLLSASENGESLLVTRGAMEGVTGVEVRRSLLRLEALGRLETRGTAPVTGWQHRFNTVNTRLHLPPGEKLVAAVGADQSPGAWISRWRLLDFFLVLIVTIAAAKLFGRPTGALALGAIVLSFHELNAPIWAWLNLLAAVALVRVAPAGRFLRLLTAYRALSLVVLVLILIPFVAGQLKIAIYPQLEPQFGYFPPPSAPVADRAGRVAVDEDLMLESKDEIAVSARQEDEREAQTYARYEPTAVVPTGPGKPAWQWNTYQLSWSGPVDPERTLRLWVVPQWAVSTLRVVIVLLVFGFAAVFVREILGPYRSRFAAAATTAGTGAVSVLLGMLALGFTPPPAEAQIPSPQILEELQRRLLTPPDCAPRCAEILAADVTLSPNSVAIRLTTNALEDVAVPLPGSTRGWQPGEVAVDGAAAPGIYRDENAVLWLRIPAGRHTISLNGPIPTVDTLEIPFPATPRVVTVDGEGWFVAGLDDRRLLAGSLQLTRIREPGTEQTTARWESTRFPPFVRVERTLMLDLDWRVVTRVRRVAPRSGAITLQVPLLANESVISQDIAVQDGQVRVSMNPAQELLTWESTLPRATRLNLTAPPGAPWSEVWGFRIGSVWHATFTGVPESETGLRSDAVRYAEFFPRPGESLVVEVVRPAATLGSTLAFDQVRLETTVGERSRTSILALNYRSTRGAQHVIQLPPDSEVMSVKIDGRNEPLTVEAGELVLPISPGEHGVQVDWRNEGLVATRATTPGVNLGAEASNINTSIALPRSRWILVTAGPRLGPAVLYWSELAVLVLFAVILGRIKTTPLSTWEWVLLGLGFSTFSWPVLGLVAAWLLALGWRGRWKASVDASLFNFVQVMMALLSVSALLAILVNLPRGLLGAPDMHVTGNDSAGNLLAWFADRSVAELPTASVISAPLWAYKALILAWALWLSFALVRWLPWGWRCFSHDELWRPVKLQVRTPSTKQKDD